MGLGSIRRIDDVILPCEDMAASRAFYPDDMGPALEPFGLSETTADLGAGSTVAMTRGG